MNIKVKYNKLSDMFYKCSKISNNKKYANRIIIFFDIILNRIIYRVSLDEYYTLELFNRGFMYGRNIVTRNFRDKVVKKHNSLEGIEIFENKALFNESYQNYLHRFSKIASEVTKSDLKPFKSEKEKFLLKPIDGYQGQGIEIIFLYQHRLDEFLSKIRYKNNYLLEEYISQNEELNKIGPNGLSVIRFGTFHNGTTPIIFAAFITLSNENPIVNYHTDGIVCLVNIDKGIIITDGTTEKGHIYTHHPLTGTRFNGFNIPYFNLAKNLVLNAAKVTPSVKYVGWDVAISEKGPVIIEGNAKVPGITTYQLPIFNNNDFSKKYKSIIK